MATVGTKVDVTLKLSQLQNLCKRDPPAYLEDYQAQVRRLQSEIQISTKPGTLVELIQFVAAVSSSSYKGEESDNISALLRKLLVQDNAHKEVRKACVSALILMRNKSAIQPLDILELFFQTMCTAEKNLREQLFRHLVNDVRNVNKKKRDEKLNRSIQTFLHKILNNESTSELACKRAIDMVCDLYRRKVWVDDRVIAIAATAVECRYVNVSNRAMRFFLNIEEIQDRDQKTSDMNEWNKSNDIDYHLYSKKTKLRKRQTERALKNKKRAQQKKDGDDEYDINMNIETSRTLFPVIELLRDPQGLAEKVFARLKSSNDKYETKLLRINFITRLVGNHELLILPLYSYLQKYMNSHQRNVTNVLAYTIQACHKLVPPDEIIGIIKTISHQFITERCSEEEMAVGINAVRAIVSRVPATLNLDYMGDLVGDLANFSKHRDRSVRMAGSSFVNCIRSIHPRLLQQKFRGMQGSALYKNKTKPLEFGQDAAAAGVEGADLLVAYEAKKKKAAKLQEVDENESSDADSDEDSDTEAPQLVKLKETDISKMSVQERNQLKQEVSKTRVFSSSEFKKMRKLVEREERAKRDPREAARRKRAQAKGEDYDDISDSDSSDDEIHIEGRVNPEHIMALASKRRISKAEKLEKIMQGRTVFEAKQREGGSTNVEKQRKKNFLMSKFSKDARRKGRGKGGLQQKRNHNQTKGTHEARKRRRKV